MGILLRKHNGAVILTGIARLAFVIFLVSLSASFIDTIWAVYLKSFFRSDSLVGFYSGLLSLLTFVSFFLFVPLIEKTSKSFLYSLCLVLNVFLFLVFAINKNLAIFIIASVFVTLVAALRITSMGIIIRDNSRGKTVSRNEGLVYSFNNTAWVLGPLIAGIVFIDYGVSIVFFASAFLTLISFFFFRMSGIEDKNIAKKTHNHVFRNFLEYFKDKNRVITYIISGGVNFWWVLIYLYMPLYIIGNGLGKIWIGIFLFAAAFPLIIFEYPFSKAAGKYGAKKFFIFGYFIVSAVVLSAFFAGNPYIVLGILVFASVGMAMLEPTTEAYFFDTIKRKDEDRFYGPYNTSIETGLILGKILPAVLLLFLPFKYIFLLFAGIMFLLFLLSFKAKNIVEGGRRR